MVPRKTPICLSNVATAPVRALTLHARPQNLDLRKLRRVRLDDADDDAEDTQRRREDLNDEDLYKQRRVLGVGESAGATRHAHGDTASEVRQSDPETPREQRVTSEICGRPLVRVRILGRVLLFAVRACIHPERTRGGGERIAW